MRPLWYIMTMSITFQCALALFVISTSLPVNVHADGVWTTYANINKVLDIAVHGETTWCLTTAGVVRWDFATHTNTVYRNFGEYCSVIAVDPYGNLWAGSSIDGLMRYDGSTIQRFTGDDGLDAISISSITFGVGNSVYIGHSWGNLSVYNGHTWHEELNDDNPFTNVPVAVKAPDNTVWAGVRGDALYHLTGGEWVRHEIQDTYPDKRFTALAVDYTGCIWAGMYSCTYRFDSASWERISTGEVTDIAVDPDNTVWIGTRFGVIKYTDGKTSLMTVENGLPDNDINALTIGSDGTIWVGTNEGIAVYDGADWTIITEECWLLNNRVDKFVVDPNGSVWLPLDQLYAFDGTSLVTFTSMNTGIEMEQVPDIGCNWDGKVWFLTSHYLVTYDGVDWKETAIPSLQRFFVSFAFDSKGRMWVAEPTNVGGPPDGGVGCYDGDNYVRYDSSNGLPVNDAGVICVAPNDDVWVGSMVAAGVSRYNGTGWETFRTANGLGGNEIYSLTISPDGTVYVGATNGTVSRFDGNSWDIFQVIGEDILWDNQIRTLAVAPDGSVWAGTFYGAFHFDGDEWVQYTVEDGLASNTVNCIDVSDTGEVWIGTSQGLSKCTPDHSTVVKEPVPHEYLLITGNYPNPFNPSTTITYTLAAPSRVTLTVYSLTGQKIATLVNGTMSAGRHSATFDGSNLASGIYFYRLISGDIRKTGSMALVK